MTVAKVLSWGLGVVGIILACWVPQIARPRYWQRYWQRYRRERSSHADVKRSWIRFLIGIECIAYPAIVGGYIGLAPAGPASPAAIAVGLALVLVGVYFLVTANAILHRSKSE